MEEPKKPQKNRRIKIPFFYIILGTLILLILLAFDFYLYKEREKSFLFSKILKVSEEKILLEVMDPIVQSFSPKNVIFEEKKGFKSWKFITPSIAEARAQAFLISEKIDRSKLRGRMEWDKNNPDIVKLSIFYREKLIGVVIFDSTITKKEEKIDEKRFYGEFAIIIDDIGYSLDLLEEIIKIKEPLTLSVLPFLPNSKKSAEIALKSGKEIIIHMPMESNNGNDLEIGIIKERMNEEEIRELVRREIEFLPQAKGVNNHKGSKITENERIMEIILRELKLRNLFFIDSRTSDNSEALKVAKRIGLPSSKRDIFIDSINSKDLIEKNILKLFKIAKKKKRAIGIAHPYPTTIEVLKELLPQAESFSVKPVFVSQILMGNE